MAAHPRQYTFVTPQKDSFVFTIAPGDLIRFVAVAYFNVDPTAFSDAWAPIRREGVPATVQRVMTFLQILSMLPEADIVYAPRESFARTLRDVVYRARTGAPVDAASVYQAVAREADTHARLPIQVINTSDVSACDFLRVIIETFGAQPRTAADHALAAACGLGHVGLHNEAYGGGGGAGAAGGGPGAPGGGDMDMDDLADSVARFTMGGKKRQYKKSPAKQARSTPKTRGVRRSAHKKSARAGLRGKSPRRR